MGVRIFLSNGSGNKEIENSQQRIQMVLTTRAIQFVTIDISAPGMQEMRSFMREKGRRREGQRNVLPPQIFNGEEYRGDYELFDIANEDNDLEEFLGIPRKNPKAEPVKTGAVASDVGKLDPGKLLKDQTAEDIEEAAASDDETEEENGATEDTDTDSEISEIHEDVFKDWKQAVEEEAFQNAGDKVLEKTDGLAGRIKDNEAKLGTIKEFDIIEDSSDESSDEDTAVEYMPDGELVRKKSRGFKQLNNCKRFWKASLMME